MWEWHKRSLRVNTRLQRESAINTINTIKNSGTFQDLGGHLVKKNRVGTVKKEVVGRSAGPTQMCNCVKNSLF